MMVSGAAALLTMSLSLLDLDLPFYFAICFSISMAVLFSEMYRQKRYSSKKQELSDELFEMGIAYSSGQFARVRETEELVALSDLYSHLELLNKIKKKTG